VRRSDFPRCLLSHYPSAQALRPSNLADDILERILAGGEFPGTGRQQNLNEPLAIPQGARKDLIGPVPPWDGYRLRTNQAAKWPSVRSTGSPGIPLMTSTAAPASANSERRIAVIIPCLNEEITIEKVVDDFRSALPGATIYVFDNNSTDRTAQIARDRGAVVIPEKRPGKGFVVQSMLSKVDADYYLMVDGDDTYSAGHAQQMLQPLMDQQADMTVGTRLAEFSHGSFPSLHLLGNRILTGSINWAFSTRLNDMLSGYRGLTRELAKSIAILSQGFEVETELTVRTLEGGFVIMEMPIPYRERPVGSVSKLRTFRDGWRVGLTIINVTRTYRPFTFYGLVGALFVIGGGLAGWVVVLDYLDDHYVEHVPLAVLATGCMILAALNFTVGVVLNTLSARMRELAYLVRLGGARND